MLKLIKEEIELITFGKGNSVSLITLASIYGLMCYLTFMLYKSFADLLTPASNHAYSFNRDSMCASPLTPEAQLLWLLGLLVGVGIIAMIEHYDNKENKPNTSK
ncbi:hypothetical protein [Pseudomonas sp. MF4836]|uniref:hypothetical protein n=1 Tax=Pseudomonas sp. MF4836 TaxID=1960827 RepID=UPI0012905B9D|nr:hypothetical protein [Pseudomonas sp. MF4836]